MQDVKKASRKRLAFILPILNIDVISVYEDQIPAYGCSHMKLVNHNR